MLLFIVHSEERISTLIEYMTLHETDEDKSHWMIDKSWIFKIPRWQVKLRRSHALLENLHSRYRHQSDFHTSILSGRVLSRELHMAAYALCMPREHLS